MRRQSRPAAAPVWIPAGTDPPGKSALAQITQRRPIVPDERFVPLPAPVGTAPYRRHLADVIGPDRARSITQAGQLRFHAVGDTGGHQNPRPQRRVAAAMTSELYGADPVSFFYHLGDVVYPHGEEGNYRPQFFAAYADYDAPIFAVPGNHDGESPAPALSGFVKTFCADALPLHDAALRIPRPPSCQPHVHWTLVHELVWMIGLYANVPEGGQFEYEQLRWLVGELQAAPDDAQVILALHQPVYGVDKTHGGNLELADALDACFAEADRIPDAVFSGHSHSYQRFTRRHGDREVPYVVAGAGGYPELHQIAAGVSSLPASFPGVDGVTLDAYEDQAHGFLTVTAGRGGADAVYTAVTEQSVSAVDAFRIGPGAG